MSTSTELTNAENAPAGESSAGQLLEKLVDFEPTTFPVLSVYLNMQPDQHGRTPDLRPYLEREFKSLAHTWQVGTPERGSFDRDAGRILAFVDQDLDRSANGLALFRLLGKGILRNHPTGRVNSRASNLCLPSAAPIPTGADRR